jgi:hypothetical protein
MEFFSMRAYTLPLATALCRKRLRPLFLFHLGKDVMAFFSPLRLGRQKIPILAPVNEWPKAIPEGDA